MKKIKLLLLLSCIAVVAVVIVIFMFKSDNKKIDIFADSNEQYSSYAAIETSIASTELESDETAEETMVVEETEVVNETMNTANKEATLSDRSIDGYKILIFNDDIEVTTDEYVSRAITIIDNLNIDKIDLPGYLILNPEIDSFGTVIDTSIYDIQLDNNGNMEDWIPGGDTSVLVDYANMYSQLSQ